MIKLNKEFPTLNTNRLILKEYDNSFIEQIAKLANDKDISKSLASMPHPFLKKNAIELVKEAKKRYEEKDVISFAIIEKSSNSYIGNINLDLCHFHKHLTLSYWIGKKFWGKGYMPEALKAVIEYSFKELKVYRVCANHFHTNKASAKVLEKAGLKLEATRKRHFKKDEEYLDVYDWGLLRSNYKG